MLHHPKAIHFPSGYPIARSPPLFVCSSPGPDPYRSLDNVYEELGPPNESDMDSEPRAQSDDDFAEDELSLGGNRSSFRASSPSVAMPIGQLTTSESTNTAVLSTVAPSTMTTSTTITTLSQTIPSISTIFQDCVNGNTSSVQQEASAVPITGEIERGTNDRNSLLSASSASTSTGGGHDRASAAGSSSSSGATRLASPDSGLAIRNRSNKCRNYSADELMNSSMEMSETSPTSPMNSSADRHLKTLPYNNHHNHSRHNQHSHNSLALNNSGIRMNNINDNDSVNNHLNHVNNNNNINNNNASSTISRDSNRNNSNNRSQYDNEVERRNQINKQLSSASLRNPLANYFNHPPHPHQIAVSNHSQQHPLVSTIFPGRLVNSSSTLSNPNNNNNNNTLRGCYQLQNDYYAPEDSLPCCRNTNNNNSMRSRTNPRPLDRRRCGNALLPLPPPPAYSPDSAYSYAEPVFNEGLLYDGYMSTPLNGMPSSSQFTNYSPSSHSLRFHTNNHSNNNHSNNYLERMAAQQPLYSHDSSFGSDSGYSQYTHNSRPKSDEGSSAGGAGGHRYGGSTSSGSSNNAASTLASVLGWTRRKEPQQSVKKTASKSMLRKT